MPVRRLPTIFSARLFVEGGGLISYGPTLRTSGGGPACTWTRFSRARSPPICLSSSQPSSSWSSTATIVQQAAALDAIIRTHVGPPPRSILDVSCGIGTQALGLAALGHAVRASDLSSAAVERARLEAARRNLAIDFTVADMRRCAEVHGSGFDVLLSADNSIPHLLSDDAIREALGNFHQCVRPGGITLLGLRDYITQERPSPQLVPYGFRVDGGSRYFVVQTRDRDGDFDDVAMYLIRTSAHPGIHVSGEVQSIVYNRSGWRYWPPDLVCLSRRRNAGALTR